MSITKKALVIMAAGLGSRYGGNKQVDRIGPDGEILMQYSIYDAIKSGFTKVIFIIKPEYTSLIEEISKDAKEKGIEIGIAYQSFSNIPSHYSIPADRIKPFGTVHAILSAKDLIKEPFAVINADDFYGRNAFITMSDALDSVTDACGAMVSYSLSNTVSANGSVTRGICKIENGRLVEITETLNITLNDDGTISDDSAGILDPNLPVSMNMWGFTPNILNSMQDSFNDFLSSIPQGDIKAEYPLPSFIGKEISLSRLSVSVYKTTAEWFGVTYIEDRPTVEKKLLKMKSDHIYPTYLKL